MRKIRKGFVCTLLIIALVFQSAMIPAVTQAKVSISKKSATVYIGESLQLKIKGTGKKVKWSSDKPYNVKVTSKGKVTPLCYGGAVITARVGGKSYKCRIKAKWPYINTEKKSMTVGDTFQLKLTGTYIRSASSSNKKVATISKNGKITAISEGRATMTINAGRCNLSCNIEVSAKSNQCNGNHTWDEGRVIVEPTCNSCGEMEYTCTVCGETRIEEFDGNIAHTPSGEWVTTVEPTETTTGEQVQYCTVCGEVALSQDISYASISKETSWTYTLDGLNRTKTMYDRTQITETLYNGEMWGFFDDTAARDIFKEINSMKAQLGSTYVWSDDRVETAKQSALSYARTGSYSYTAEVYMNSGGLPNVSDNRRYITFGYNSNSEIAIACFVRDSAGLQDITYGESWQSYFGTYYASY